MTCSKSEKRARAENYSGELQAYSPPHAAAPSCGPEAPLDHRGERTGNDEERKRNKSPPANQLVCSSEAILVHRLGGSRVGVIPVFSHSAIQGLVGRSGGGSSRRRKRRTLWW